MKKINFILLQLLMLSCLLVSSCKKETKEGKLFIIGGGEISSAVIDKMITESGLDKGGYGVILPMSSEEPDTAFIYTKADFVGRGCKEIFEFTIKKGESFSPSAIDSIRNARMIFISGGDQSRFMDIIAGTPVKKTIHEAYTNGTLVCGTSAGAALMSKIMITGNEYKHPENTGNFVTMELKNVETIEGLGMLENVIIDQHFIKRRRLNRLISVSMENPGKTCVGIDESTAILVDKNSATVYGASQVIVLRNKSGKAKAENGLIGTKGLQMDVMLPGEKFQLKH